VKERLITLLCATTKPLPSLIFSQLCDSPCTLTTLGLDLKATIEQFREQVQNVE